MTPGAEQQLNKTLERIARALEKLSLGQERLAGELVLLTQEVCILRKVNEVMGQAVMHSLPEATKAALCQELYKASEERAQRSNHDLDAQAAAHPIDPLEDARARDLDAVLQVNRALAAGVVHVGASGLVELAQR